VLFERKDLRLWITGLQSIVRIDLWSSLVSSAMRYPSRVYSLAVWSNAVADFERVFLEISGVYTIGLG
jgi:hypothetical protein